ncbi:hypothetical protein GPUN_2524 [Glaciecola punicea ACAM 611]|uniref:Uncharacterized protein n=1 Tax=Glaciecola punicea ACAM 611 TaxID=1121923 RepID=H5TEB2_9ALTE|nr:hypothetical protein GPUN_2524 [Glaciecola punicea ACAM 611]
MAGFAFFCTVIPSLLVAEAIHKIGPELTSSGIDICRYPLG